MAIAPTTTCITNTINLQPGTSFILPPGSTIVGTSDINNLTSDCADLTNIETYACYVALIVTNPDNGNLINYFEGKGGDKSAQGADDGGAIKGFKYNGVNTSFNSLYGLNDDNGTIERFNELAAEVQQKVSGIIGTRINYITDRKRGTINYLIINTLPSIAKNLQIITQVQLSDQAFSPNMSLVYTDFELLSDKIAQGYQYTVGMTFVNAGNTSLVFTKNELLLPCT